MEHKVTNFELAGGRQLDFKMLWTQGTPKEELPYVNAAVSFLEGEPVLKHGSTRGAATGVYVPAITPLQLTLACERDTTIHDDETTLGQRVGDVLGDLVVARLCEVFGNDDYLDGLQIHIGFE
jgi:hypothetical protein